MAEQHKNVIDGIVDYLFGVTAKNHSKPRPPEKYDDPMWMYGSIFPDQEAKADYYRLKEREATEDFDPNVRKEKYPFGVPVEKKTLSPQMQFLAEQFGESREDVIDSSRNVGLGGPNDKGEYSPDTKASQREFYRIENQPSKAEQVKRAVETPVERDRREEKEDSREI